MLHGLRLNGSPNASTVGVLEVACERPGMQAGAAVRARDKQSSLRRPLRPLLGRRQHLTTPTPREQAAQSAPRS